MPQAVSHFFSKDKEDRGTASWSRVPCLMGISKHLLCVQGSIGMRAVVRFGNVHIAGWVVCVGSACGLQDCDLFYLAFLPRTSLRMIFCRCSRSCAQNSGYYCKLVSPP